MSNDDLNVFSKEDLSKWSQDVSDSIKRKLRSTQIRNNRNEGFNDALISADEIIKKTDFAAKDYVSKTDMTKWCDSVQNELSHIQCAPQSSIRYTDGFSEGINTVKSILHSGRNKLFNSDNSYSSRNNQDKEVNAMGFQKGTHFTDEQLAAAKNQSTVDIIERATGYTFERAGGEYKCKEHDSLRVFHDQKGWKWYSRDIGGANAIDFLMKSEGLGFQDAVAYIVGDARSKTISSEYKSAAPTETKRSEFKPPERFDGQYMRVYGYLLKTRQIERSILDHCVKNNLIYQDTSNNCVFAGYDSNGEMKYATKRGTSTEYPFKGECLGSDKRFSFRLEGKEGNTVYVFEAPIDVLSHATLTYMKAQQYNRPDYQKSWQRQTRISLGGLSDAALEQYLSEHKNVREICFCLDNDEAGRKAANKYSKKYAEKGFETSVYRVPDGVGKDYNDYLCAYKKALNNSNTLNRVSTRPAIALSRMCK